MKKILLMIIALFILVGCTQQEANTNIVYYVK